MILNQDTKDTHMNEQDYAQLQQLREQIDVCNRAILDTLNQRAQAVRAVGALKANQSDRSTPYYTPEREAYILQTLHQYNQDTGGLLSNRAIDTIFREIISASLALEKPMQIGYLGPAGSYTHLAARKNFGGSADYTPVADIASLCTSLASDTFDCVVVPIENSTAGIVGQTIDAFDSTHDFTICNELVMPIHHALLTKTPTELNKIERVVAHKQSLLQCRQWLAQHLPHAQLEDVSSNTKAATLLDSYENTAAIAHESVAQLYDLNVHARHIEDQVHNSTRFFVLRQSGYSSSIAPRSAVGQQIDFRSAMLVYGHNAPGLLARLLQPLDEHHINCTSLHSYPSKQDAWSYFFYIEFVGHMDTPRTKAMLDALRQVASQVTFLGSYPAAAAPLQ